MKTEFHPKNVDFAGIRRCFKVSVVEVNTLIKRGQERRVGGKRLKSRNWKKAIVSLREGDTIEVFEGI